MITAAFLCHVACISATIQVWLELFRCKFSLIWCFLWCVFRAMREKRSHHYHLAAEIPPRVDPGKHCQKTPRETKSECCWHLLAEGVETTLSVSKLWETDSKVSLDIKLWEMDWLAKETLVVWKLASLTQYRYPGSSSEWCIDKLHLTSSGRQTCIDWQVLTKEMVQFVWRFASFCGYHQALREECAIRNKGNCSLCGELQVALDVFKLSEMH